MVGIPSWFAIVMVVWTFVGGFVAYKKEWLCMPERSATFPFTARQFFAIALVFVLLIGAYIFASFLGHSLALALAQTPLCVSFSNRNEVIAVDQLFMLSFAALGIALIMSLLPVDLYQIIAGKSGGVKKWARGFFLGALFYPVISLSTWIINMVMTIIAPQFEATQVALLFLAQARGTGMLFWFLILYIILLVPYIEEMVFRGALQGFLGGILHPTLTVILTGLCFSFFHYSPLQKGSNVEIIVGLFVFSWFASRIRIKEDAVASSIGLHAGFNATSIIFFLSQAN